MYNSVALILFMVLSLPLSISHGYCFLQTAFPPSLPSSLFVFRGRSICPPALASLAHTNPTTLLHFISLYLTNMGPNLKADVDFIICKFMPTPKSPWHRENTLFWDVSWVLSSSAQGGIAWGQNYIFSIWAPKFSTGALQQSAGGLVPWSSPLYWPRCKHP